MAKESKENPSKIGKYRIQKRLGNGAYGVTYRVHDIDNPNVPLALKWQRKDAPEEAPFRFENEVWALEKLDHPSVPRFVEKGIHLDRPYIVMGFAPGQTLKSMLMINQQENGRLSQRRTLLIAEGLLEVLAYVHGEGVVHRDVKDDNVIVTGSGDVVTLIDFGVCKGTGAPAEGKTFWHAGASRFSPPDKLRHPTSHNRKHDVFAAGVICYLLLTNDYPWKVSAGFDSGHLEALMRSESPRPIRQLNPNVDKDVADAIQSLLTIEDHNRPTAEEAAEEFRKIREAKEKSTRVAAISNAGAIQFPHVMRDALHGDIPMTDFEFALVNSKEFQRLRRIRQLGFSNLVYPGAEHSRFAHAVGTMHVTENILERIEKRTGIRFDNDEHLLVRTFALMHDITHMPFGHTLEDELSLFERHDTNSDRLSRILSAPNSEVGRVLESTDYGRIAFDLLRKEYPAGEHIWVDELVSSPVGADVIDYVDRDALFCGLDHRVDSAVFRRFAIDTTPVAHSAERHVISKLYGRHGFRLDADYAILSLLRERFAIFLKVYTHQTKVAAGAMLGKAIQNLREKKVSGFSEEILERMSDDELLLALRSVDEPVVKNIADRIWVRDLYEPIFRAQVLPPDQRNPQQYETRRKTLSDRGLFTPEGRASLEEAYASRAKISADDIIVYTTRRAPGAQKVRQYVEIEEGGKNLRDEVHTPHLEIFSDHLALWQIYVFARPELPTEKKNVVAEYAAQNLHFMNTIQIERRQLGFRF